MPLPPLAGLRVGGPTSGRLPTPKKRAMSEHVPDLRKYMETWIKSGYMRARFYIAQGPDANNRGFPTTQEMCEFTFHLPSANIGKNDGCFDPKASEPRLLDKMTMADLLELAPFYAQQRTDRPGVYEAKVIRKPADVSYIWDWVEAAALSWDADFNCRDPSPNRPWFVGSLAARKIAFDD